jgi:acetyl/propionyl-CoA carboxylase alpha subunit
VLETDAFHNSLHHTALIDTQWPCGWDSPPVTNKLRMEAALAFLIWQQVEKKTSPWQTLGAWRITQAAGRMGAASFYVRDSDGVDCVALISGRDGSYAITLDDARVVKIKNVKLSKNILTYENGGHNQSTSIQIVKQKVILCSGPNTYCLSVLTSEQALLGAFDSQGVSGDIIAATMPGLIVEVKVSEGERVEVGQTLVVLEAMKLLQNLTAPRSGVIATIRYQAGDTVDGKVALVTLEPVE